MSVTARPVSRVEEYAELHSGDRMTREEFHRIYSQMPDKFKAELIGGTVYVPASVCQEPGLELHTGDRMTREEFHRIYSQMPESSKAELIGGIVYVASPLKIRQFEISRQSFRRFWRVCRIYPGR